MIARSTQHYHFQRFIAYVMARQWSYHLKQLSHSAGSMMSFINFLIKKKWTYVEAKMFYIEQLLSVDWEWEVVWVKTIKQKIF